jgi:hypothetical protein
MTRIRSIVRDRRVEIPAPDDLPDGAEVLVEVISLPDKIGIDESEWRDDAEALADWAAWLDTIEPIDFAEPDPFDEQFRRFNVEAVRRQMFEEGE